MKNKRIAFIVGAIAIILIAATVALILINSFAKKPDLNKIIGKTISLENAKDYVYELKDTEITDDFSKAFMARTTMRIIEIDEEGGTAKVEFCVPDTEKIMLENLPTDESGDYNALLSEYYSDITKAISSVKDADMIKVEIECSVIKEESESSISIEGAPLFNYQDILADILIDIIGEAGDQ